jgi:hypothetical protein
VVDNAGDEQDPFSTDLFGNPALTPLTPIQARTLDAAAEIMQDPPDKASYLHSILCQVGMPRKRTEGRSFERRSGTASMLLEAGKLWNGGEWVEQPLPYGARPRLVMVHISSEALRSKRREVSIGESAREFMLALGIEVSGGPRGNYGMLRQQMEALAACRLSLGYKIDSKAVTLDAKPFSRFDAWVRSPEKQRSMFPAEIQLSQEFFDTLMDNAVPLDPRALGALKDSALAIDIYTWLAHRLCRIPTSKPTMVSWFNLRDQFGQEYADPKDFKKAFRISLKRVIDVYPEANVYPTIGGFRLLPSKPPIPKTRIIVALPEA